MSSVLIETVAFADELIADFIETGDFKGEKGVVWAIRYLTQKDLSELKAQSAKAELRKEMESAARAEKRILDGFEAFLPSWSATIILTKQEKTKNIAYFVEDIATIFSLRNKKHPEELSKLEKLRSKTDASDHVLVIRFWRTESWRYFVKSVRINKSVPSEDGPGSWKWSKGPDYTNFA